METKDDLVVGGYHFATVADAETARLDAKRIQNLEDNLDYKKPQNVLMLYHKALDTRILQTPIGFAYLLQIQEHLKRCGIPEDKIRPIPLNTTFSNKTEANRSIRRSVAARQPEYKGRFITSVCFNVLMALVIIAMFSICLKSDTPNIINYRREIVNEYSEWEQELTQREQAVREAEKRIGNP
ncbi:MAG: hypothetical protein NC231_06060 [Bacillus sp. (in: Bacteria)]|nr:hypothetical protein [Bacillus sp. (in: firmicutes)]MCM1427605.1 hypothetical protein [Eubacterium sp.]